MVQNPYYPTEEQQAAALAEYDSRLGNFEPYYGMAA